MLEEGTDYLIRFSAESEHISITSPEVPKGLCKERRPRLLVWVLRLTVYLTRCGDSDAEKYVEPSDLDSKPSISRLEVLRRSRRSRVASEDQHQDRAHCHHHEHVPAVSAIRSQILENQ